MVFSCGPFPAQPAKRRLGFVFFLGPDRILDWAIFDKKRPLSDSPIQFFLKVDMGHMANSIDSLVQIYQHLTKSQKYKKKEISCLLVQIKVIRPITCQNNVLDLSKDLFMKRLVIHLYYSIILIKII